MDYYDPRDVKSNVTKFLLPEHVRSFENPSAGHNNSIYTHKDISENSARAGHNNSIYTHKNTSENTARAGHNNSIYTHKNTSENTARADAFLYNETVMRRAFAQFLRRLADQVESGLISLSDAISLSPCHTSAMPMTGQQNLNTNTTFTNAATTSSSSNNNNSINLTQIDSSSPSPSPPPMHINQTLVPSKQSPPSPQPTQYQILDEESLHEESLHEVDSQSLGHYLESSLGALNGDTRELRHMQQQHQEEGKPQIFTPDESKDQSFHIKAVSLLSSEMTPSQDPYPDILVDSIRLQSLLQRIQALDDPATPADMHRLSLSILREAITLTFTKIELANASGLGLRRTRTESGYPLDRKKIEAIKLFYTSICVQRQWPKVSKSTFHKAFTIKISNAKRDLRRL